MSCAICEKVSPDICDGLCDNCESLWLNQISRLSKELPPETSIPELFNKATIAAKEIKQKSYDK